MQVEKHLFKRIIDQESFGSEDFRVVKERQPDGYLKSS
jgi:hypothetical protein